jgi:cytochrome c biogenesis protein CcdA
MSGKRYPAWFEDAVGAVALAVSVLALVFGVAGLLAYYNGGFVIESLRLFMYAAVTVLVVLVLEVVLLFSKVRKRRDAEEKLEGKGIGETDG